MRIVDLNEQREILGQLMLWTSILSELGINLESWT
jgi:hypothetical protein